MRSSFRLPFARWLAPPAVAAVALLTGNTIRIDQSPGDTQAISTTGASDLFSNSAT